MKFYSNIEQELISGFTRRLHEEFKKQYKDMVHFDLMRCTEDDRYFTCDVTFIHKGFTIYRTQLKVAWSSFSEGIQYDVLAKFCCTTFRKWLNGRYFY